MLKSKMILISLLMLMVMLLLINCETPTTPDIPEPNWADYELMYERVKAIINAKAPDPTGDRFTIYHGILGGTNSGPMKDIGQERWLTEVTLEFHKVPYSIWLIDQKVVPLK